MKVDTSIFKAYDIRGIYPDSLDENLAEKIGRAYSQAISKEKPEKKLKIAVGEDMRISSPSLKKSLIKGLTESGVDVIDIGLVTTPTFYFAVGFYGYDGGIQVSASHNPKEYNGLKMVRANAAPIGGETGIYEMRDLVLKNKFTDSEAKGIVSEKRNVVNEVVIEQRKGIEWKKIKPFKIVVDTGNGMGALDVDAIFKDLPCKLVKINYKLDGNFPVHTPDPLKDKNLAWVKKSVIKENADLGIATDGDGDRWFFIDEKGETVDQPILRGLMAQIELEENPGATVCYDIRPGKITKDMIEAAGGNAVVTKVGHSLIKKTMLEKNAIFGGESSGHYFYKFDYGTFEAPVVLVLKFLKYMSAKNKPVSVVLAKYKKYFHSGEINSEVKDKKGKIAELLNKYSDGEINKLDGITIGYKDYWFNVRPSNTEDLLRFQIEAVSKEIMENKREEILEIIRK